MTTMTSLIPAPNAFVAHKTPFNVRIRTGEYNAAAYASWSLVWVQTQCSASSIKEATLPVGNRRIRVHERYAIF